MGTTGAAPPTIKDIARRAGVSISTVHYALRRTRPISDETRRRVLDAIYELDYHPHAGAATLPSGRTGRLGVVIGGIEPAFANTYFSDLIRGLAAAAEEEDHTVVLYTAYGRRTQDGWRPAHVLRRREADGLLLAGTQISGEHLDELAALGTPCVLLNREHPTLPWIAPDRRQGARLGAAHLLDHGRRRLGLLGASYRGGVPDEQRAELLGFRDALRERGLSPTDHLARFAPVGVDDEEGRGAETLTRSFIGDLVGGAERPGDAGLLVFSYTLGPSAARAVEGSGVGVGDGLGLVMGDEDPAARGTLRVPPTTVQARKFEMAREAARLLLRLLRHEEVPDEEQRQRFTMELKVGWSCGAQRQSRH